MKLLRKNKGAVAFIIIVLVWYAIAISRCDLETEENTNSVTGVISNLEYISFQKTVTFNVGELDFHIGTTYGVPERNLLRTLEKNKTEVTIIYNDEIDVRRPHFIKFAKFNVVDMRSDYMVYYSIEDYNSEQIIWMIVYTCIAVFAVSFAMIYIFSDIIIDKVLNILDKKSRKKLKDKKPRVIK